MHSILKVNNIIATDIAFAGLFVLLIILLFVIGGRSAYRIGKRENSSVIVGIAYLLFVLAVAIAGLAIFGLVFIADNI